MPFIIMQQVQPCFIMAAQHSQHAWIMAAQALSPLVQVTQTPISVASHLHMPIIRLQQHAVIPFIIMQQLTIPPAAIVQRFWSMPAETLSSQVQVIFIPPVHFSKVMVQRGTIIMFMPAGVAAGAPIIPAGPAIPTPAMPIPGRSVIIAFIVGRLLPGCLVRSPRASPTPGLQVGAHSGRPDPRFQGVGRK
jgi:hypothetical protein